MLALVRNDAFIKQQSDLFSDVRQMMRPQLDVCRGCSSATRAVRCWCCCCDGRHNASTAALRPRTTLDDLPADTLAAGMHAKLFVICHMYNTL